MQNKFKVILYLYVKQIFRKQIEKATRIYPQINSEKSHKNKISIS